MYKLDLPIDYKEAAKIERRRLLEEQRQNRVFNAKYRQIGVDVDALDSQVKERKDREEKEKLRDLAFASDLTKNDQVATVLDGRSNETRRRLEEELNNFRAVHQRPQDAREWDLNDPDALKKEKPARVSDEDPRCTAYNCQRFEGEDLNSKARKLFQQEQMRIWANQQIRNRDRANSSQREADRLYAEKLKELDRRAQELQLAEDQCRKAINIATGDFNAALAKEQAERSRLKTKQEDDEKRTEVQNAIFGDFLTENPAQAMSLFGPHRVVTDRWKGMTPEQLDEVRKFWEFQKQEKARLQEEERQFNEEWERQLANNDRAGTLLEREEERNRRKEQRRLAEENLRLAREQKDHRQYLDKEINTNQPTAAYFMQWNTTSR